MPSLGFLANSDVPLNCSGRLGVSWSELTPWALAWLRRMRCLYQVNRERLQHTPGSAKFQEHDVVLRRAVEAMRVEAQKELSDPRLRQPCRKVLESLQEHWQGLVRFVEEPRIPASFSALTLPAFHRPHAGAAHSLGKPQR